MTDNPVDPTDQTPRLQKMRAPFPPEQVGKLPKGGVFLDYVGHADITARLLDVDPYWTWAPFALDPAGFPAVDKDGNLWIRLTVCGVTRIGVGDGKNAKERIGDALRNAAMRFGAALELWAKGDRDFAQHQEAQRPQPPGHIMRVLAAVRDLPADDKKALRAWYDKTGFPADLNHLGEDEAVAVCDYIESLHAFPSAVDPRHPDEMPVPS